ncbi:hypothetical protein LCGC14_1752580, partial [marine sediment metagenome]
MEESVKPPAGEDPPESTGSERRISNAMSKLRVLYGRLDHPGRLAAIASLVLVVSEFFPWYRGK